MSKLAFDRVSRTLLVSGVLLWAVAGCGGGGGGGDGGGGGPTWTAGVFQPSSNFANRCAAPRSGIDPSTGRPYPDLTGQMLDENNWLRSWTHELYLWYSEVPDLNPALYTTPQYFDLLKTTATTPSGQPKDKFHFTYDTDEWIALSLGGTEVGYGVQFALLATTPPRQAVVAYVEPSQTASIGRGAEVLRVDGVDLVNDNTAAGVATLNAGLFPESVGESHTFVIRDVDGTQRTVTLIADEITSAPVQNVRTISTPTGLVGYLLFNDHIATAEDALVDAVNDLKAAGIQDLVLDIRYNGGGFLAIASELAYMIAGPTQTAGRTFELLQFNDKHPTTNPITGEPITPTPFANTTLGFSRPAGQPLPTLNLSRVYVLTGSGTCSASESIINGLRGVDVEVIQIGSTTCGKPYGFYPQDNCGTTYFSIQFRGVNAKNFGDYTDGFSPQNTVGVRGVLLPGCSVADDFTHELGDEEEGRLAVALNYRATGSCSVAPSGMMKPLAAAASEVHDAIIPKSPWRQNRIMRP
ncbi:MAG: peptidase [Steroidobacteraceae bacterium]|nr:peptidase [Steroidobacteraceae bacterium]